jgi:hypothetical protein
VGFGFPFVSLLEKKKELGVVIAFFIFPRLTEVRICHETLASVCCPRELLSVKVPGFGVSCEYARWLRSDDRRAIKMSKVIFVLHHVQMK